MFLIDVSGPMDSPRKLPLLERSMQRTYVEVRATGEVMALNCLPPRYHQSFGDDRPHG